MLKKVKLFDSLLFRVILRTKFKVRWKENQSPPSKKRASLGQYTPENQLSIDLFDSPFGKELDPSNRWIALSSKNLWDNAVAESFFKTIKLEWLNRFKFTSFNHLFNAIDE